MSDLLKHMEALREHVDVDADTRHVAMSLAAARRRSARRQRTRVAVSSVAVLLLVLAGGRLLRQERAAAPRAVASAVEAPVPAESAGVVRLDDGSAVTAIERGSELRLAGRTATEVRVQLLKGAYRFDVTRSKERTFRVEMGEVAVEVMGTSFTVDRENDRVGVHVLEGRVRVLSSGRPRVLSANDELWLPLQGGAEAEHDPEPAALPPPTKLRPLPPAESWKRHAAQGNYARAFGELERAAVKPKGPQDLMLAADAARLSGHPREATRYLQGVLRTYEDDPLAALAAFTLGRVLLNELGQPAPAAEAFARTRQLNPETSLAEDALAREVEAWAKAHRPELARERAREYARTYPAGRRLEAVRRFGEAE